MITTTVVYWPDGRWCSFYATPRIDHLYEGTKVLHVPMTHTGDQIDELVQMLVTIGE